MSCWLPARWVGWPELRPVEIGALTALLVPVVLIGVAPAWLLRVIDTAVTLLRRARREPMKPPPPVMRTLDPLGVWIWLTVVFRRA